VGVALRERRKQGSREREHLDNYFWKYGYEEKAGDRAVSGGREEWGCKKRYLILFCLGLFGRLDRNH
jgi:hypothetical protein